MIELQTVTDRFSMGLSLACAAHCLLTPVLLTIVPSVAALGLENEAFHLWMVIVVIPMSIFALTLGCKKHKRYQVLISGVFGICLLISALIINDFVGESGEKILTTAGAAFVAIGHWFNFRLCRKSAN
jgi:hypothetical protein